jgi:hypothetical protein
MCFWHDGPNRDKPPKVHWFHDGVHLDNGPGVPIRYPKRYERA